MKRDIKTWLIEWIKKNAGVDGREIVDSSSCNFFDKGWIDSFKFITFIHDIEEYYNLRFNNDEFQDKEFSTIEGLTSIIEVRIK